MVKRNLHNELFVFMAAHYRRGWRIGLVRRERSRLSKFYPTRVIAREIGLYYDVCGQKENNFVDSPYLLASRRCYVILININIIP